MLVYIVGHKGWIGQQFINYFQHSNIPVTFSQSNIRAESDELCHEIKKKSRDTCVMLFRKNTWFYW